MALRIFCAVAIVVCLESTSTEDEWLFPKTSLNKTELRCYDAIDSILSSGDNFNHGLEKLEPPLANCHLSSQAIRVESWFDRRTIDIPENFTLLHFAASVSPCRQGDLNCTARQKRIVDKLLALGANLEARDASNHETPLLVAARFNNSDVVEALVSARAHVNAADKYARTPLLWAAANHNFAMIQTATAGKPDSNKPSVTAVKNVIDNGAGLLIRPNAARLLHEDVILWRQSGRAFGQLYGYNRTTLQYTKRLEDVFRSRGDSDDVIAERVRVWTKFYVDFLLQDSKWRRDYINRLMQVKAIPRGDPRIALRGQEGTFARVDILANTILGAYAGILLRKGSTSEPSFDRRAELDMLEEQTGAEAKNEDIRRYSFTVPLAGRNGSESRQRGNFLTLSGIRRSNALSAINSYWAPPVSAKDNERAYNTNIMFLRLNDFPPLVIFYTGIDVKAGQELLTDYGRGYWKRSFVNFSPPKRLKTLKHRFFKDAVDTKGPWRITVHPDEVLMTGAELHYLGMFDHACLSFATIELPDDVVAARNTRCPNDVMTQLFLNFPWDKQECSAWRPKLPTAASILELIEEVRQEKSKIFETSYDNSAGLLIRPEAAAILERDIASFQASNPKHGEVYVFDELTKTYEFGDVWYYEHWRSYYLHCLFPESLNWRRAHLAELVEVRNRNVTASGKSKHGPKIVVAARAIHKHTLIGLYAGMLVKQGSTQDPSFDARAEMEWLEQAVENVTIADMAKYSIKIPDVAKRPSNSKQPTTTRRAHAVSADQLIISGLSRSNAIALIAPASEDRKPNVALTVIRMDRNPPMVVCFATREIAANEELLLAPFRLAGFSQPHTTRPHPIAETNSLLLTKFAREAARTDDPWRYYVEPVHLNAVGHEIFQLGLLGETCLLTEQPIVELADTTMRRILSPFNARKCSASFKSRAGIGIDWPATDCSLARHPKPSGHELDLQFHQHKLHAVTNTYDNSAHALVRPEAASILQRDIKQWLKLKPKLGQLYLYNHELKKYIPAEDGGIHRLAVKHWKSYYLEFLYGTNRWRRAYIDKLVRVERLGKDYSRPALRGQMGVFANVKIQELTIIGSYTGVLLREGSLSDGSFDRRAELDWIHKWDPKVTDSELRRYSFDVFPAVPQNDTSYNLLYSALRRSNAISMVNAYWAPPETQKDNRQDFNVDFDCIRMDDHIPIIVYYARKEIPRNKELFTDYGPGYWTQPISREKFRLAVPPKIATVTSRFIRDASLQNGAWMLAVSAVNPAKLAESLHSLGQMNLLQSACLNGPVVELPENLVLSNSGKCRANFENIVTTASTFTEQRERFKVYKNRHCCLARRKLTLVP